MASAELLSNNPNLELRDAVYDGHCVGVFIERGVRPGRLCDVWMLGRSRRCVVTIAAGSQFVANQILPPAISNSMHRISRLWLPTCLYCAIETYGEYFEGPTKVNYLRPISPEMMKQIEERLVRLFHEAKKDVLR